MSPIAIKLLTIPSTSIASEKIFSFAGLIYYNKKR
ncbi:MAG: hAT transposon family protein [Colwellia sp.]|nr:hAT transposon family protein [Colwellia sp.]